MSLNRKTWPRWRNWVGAGLMAACLGCQFASQSLPSDPLFVSRKPIEAKAEFAQPVTVAFTEPVMPLDPIALARQKQKTVPGVLTGRPAKAPPLIINDIK